MESGRIWKNICPECGRHVEILNGDFEFSMQLHNQSHKSLNLVNSIDINLNPSTEKLDKNPKLNLNFCNECNDNFEIINNDLNLSFQLHAQRHKQANTDTLTDHSSTSSSKSENSKQVMKEKSSQPTVTSILDAVFHTMPLGLQAHRNFISEKSCSKGFCNLCGIVIDPIFSVSEHLKTKLHEDNTISVIKAIFTSELHDQMKFISFYGSNLCCNLCRGKIDLCSENIYKTAVNIFSHNAGKEHSSQRIAGGDSNQSSKAFVALKSLALKNPIVNENQHLIERKLDVQFYFLCKPCDKRIMYSENEDEMVNNFTTHFNSSGHLKYLSSISLLTKWSSLKVTGKENHNFCVTKQQIHCLSCKTDVETNLDQLLSHIKKNSGLNKVVNLTVDANPVPNYNDFKIMNLSYGETSNPALGDVSKEEYLRSKSHESTNNPSNQKTSQTQDFSAKFRRLVQFLPIQFQNVLTENKKGEVTCSVCKCTIPSSMYNITTHLEGASHKKKHNESKLLEKGINSPQTSRVIGPGATATNIDVELNLLMSKNRSILENREYLIKQSDANKYLCTLCGIFINVDLKSLEKNLMFHIQCNDHVHKIRIKKEMLPLLPKHSNTLAKEFFNPIPMRFQKDIKYIKVMDGVNFVFCVICCVKISRHTSCLLEHLEGTYHGSSVERMAGIHAKKVAQLKPDDVQFKGLLKSNKVIKAHSKYLSKTGDDYLCKPCKAIIKNSPETDVLKRNILSHINGKKHKNSVEDEFSTLVDKVQIKSVIVKNNRKFIKTENDQILCTMCNCHMSKADCVDTLKHSLEEHFKGSSHINKVISSVKPELGASNNLSQLPQTLNEMSLELEAIIAKLPPFTKP